MSNHVSGNKNPLDVVASAVIEIGWQLGETTSELFQNHILFYAQTRHIGYQANVSCHADGVLHLEVVVQFVNISDLKRPEYMRLLNMVNQDISTGSLSHTVDDDGSEYLVHRAQLYYDLDIGITENQAATFIQACVAAIDLCVPAISNFLAVKPKGYLNAEGLIDQVTLQITPEETMNMILYAPFAGHA